MDEKRLAIVLWRDAFSMCSWLSFEEALEEAHTQDWLVTEVGWILEETPEYILIASQFQHGGSWGNITKIPKQFCLKVQNLKVGTGRRKR